MAGSGVAYDVGSWRLGDDGCIHRRGRMRFANGDLYDGEWVDGKRHGKGTLRLANGSSYVGDFDDNFYHGFGLLTVVRTQHPLTKKWVPGERYEGEFRRGKRHGRGVAKTPSGDTYDGAYAGDLFHGRGVCAYANGDVFDGQWVRGRWHGSGELRRRDGSAYVGDFVSDLFHGFGKFVYDSGGKHGFYAGDYRFGQRHGKGVRIFGDGKRYEGDWADDAMHGVGMMECEAFKYVGEFVDGKFHGHGVMSYTNGDSYEGSFLRGEREGHGRFEYSDGGRYDGEFHQSKRHGKGTRVFSTSDTYDGEWRFDLTHGRGVLARKIKLPGGHTATFRYDGDFCGGEQTGRTTITYEYVPANAHDLFEWKDEYEFPLGSGLWHCGRGESTYKGDMYRGSFHGDGELVSPDGRRWQGRWASGQLHGEGQCVYLPLIHEHLMENEKLPAHAKRQLMVTRMGLYRIVRYDGEFARSVRQGRGRLLYENGDRICGHFEQGFAHGVVLYRFSTDKERHAEFKHGQRQRWLSDEEEQAVHAQEAAEQHTQTENDAHRRYVLRAMMV